jgi:ATP-dependent helicase IRC3
MTTLLENENAPEQPATEIPPREYQIDAYKASEKAIESGRPDYMLVLPTGTGKTFTSLYISKCRARARRTLGRTSPFRVLWLAHRRELITQPKKALAGVWPDAQSGIVKASVHEDYAADIVFASIQTLTGKFGEKRVATMIETSKAMGRDRPFDKITLDECHHYLADTYAKPIQSFIEPYTTDDDPVILEGLTATPIRADGKKLDDLFSVIAYSMSIDDAIRQGYLVNYISDRIFLPKLDIDKLGGGANGKDFDKAKLDAEFSGDNLLRNGAAAGVANAIKDKCVGRKTIVFCCTVDQARRTSLELEKLGIKSGYVSYETSDTDRDRILGDFTESRIQVLCNSMVLTEGFDCPDVSAVVVARPTMSQGLFIQMVGRGLRLHVSKTNCLILDLVGASKLHTLSINMDDVRKSRRTKEQLEDDTGLEVIDSFGDGIVSGNEGNGEAVDMEDDLVRNFLTHATSESFSQRKHRWVKVTPQIWTLPVDKGNVTMWEAKGGWAAELTQKDKAPVVLTAQPLPMEMVQGIAEEHARKLGAFALTWKTAAWRRLPANKQQRDALAAWKIPEKKDGLLAGDASDILMQVVTRTRYQGRVGQPL